MELHQPSGRTALGLALAGTTVVLWGVLPLALELVLAELDPVTITWFRFGFSGLALGALLGARRGLPPVHRLGRGGLVLLVVATAGLAANYLAYLVGLDLTSPANAQVLIQAAPLLLAMGGIVVFRERFTRGQWLGVGVLVAGLGLFFQGQLRALAGSTGTEGYLQGVAAMTLASSTWAVYGLAQKQLLRTLSSQEIMLCIYLGCFACFSFGAAPSGLRDLSSVGLAALLFTGANTLVAYGTFAAALEHWQASRVSALLSLTPLATLGFTLAGAWLLPEWVAAEHVGAASLVGASLVVGGSMLVSLTGRN